jgi:hypothetical protein
MRYIKLIVLLTLMSIAFSDIVTVPSGLIFTIQGGINYANEGDTVLVLPGTYYENVDFDGKSNITLTSQEIFTGDENDILTTIINGNHQGCCIKLVNEEENIVIRGFCITNGLGESTYTTTNISGSGIKMLSCNNIDIINCKIYGNEATNSAGMLISDFCPNVYMSGVSIYDNIGDGIKIFTHVIFDPNNRCSIYNNYPQDIYTSNQFGDPDNPEIFEIILDTFTVISPTDNYFAFHDGQSGYSFDILNGWMELIDQDLYVSADGDDSNSGLTPDDPLYNIEWACQKIVSDSLNPNTVHVADGFYSSDAGQIFPIVPKRYMNLVGESEENTILTHEEGIHVIINQLNWSNIINTIENFTLKDLSFAFGVFYAGIDNVKTVINNMTIENVDLEEKLFIGYEHGYIEANNLTIRNTVTHREIGRASLFVQRGSMKLTNCIFDNNRAPNGGNGSGDFKPRDFLYVENCQFVNGDGDYLDEWSVGLNVGFWEGMYEVARTTIVGTIFANNNTEHSWGIVLGCDTINVVNCTFVGNQADLSVVVRNQHPITLYNCIMWNPTDYEFWLDFIPVFDPPRIMTVSNSLIKNGIDGICNVDPWTGECNTSNSDENYEIIWIDNLDADANPMFADSLGGDFSLSYNSPCIDAGTLDLPDGIVLPEFDLAGNPRIVNGQVDMGAFEFQGNSDINYQSSIINFQLLNAYPNPFNPVTVIGYQCPEPSTVNLAIYNINGQLVETLIDVNKTAGYHEVIWDATDYPSGVYFAKMQAGEFTETQKLILLK